MNHGLSSLVGTHRRARSRPIVTVGLLLIIATAAISGCAVFKQEQYFAARDPETGATSYYKMTITGNSGFGTDYRLQAGYFSSQAVDVLRGSMPKVPILDLPVERFEKFNDLTNRFFDALVTETKRTHPLPENNEDNGDGEQHITPVLDEEQVKRLTRLLWLGSLSSPDLASVGATQSTNPFEFRKLVFWTTAQNVDLTEYATEIDAVLGNVVSVAQIAHARAKNKKESQENKIDILNNLVDKSTLTEEQKAFIKSILTLSQDTIKKDKEAPKDKDKETNAENAPEVEKEATTVEKPASEETDAPAGGVTQ